MAEIRLSELGWILESAVADFVENSDYFKELRDEDTHESLRYFSGDLFLYIKSFLMAKYGDDAVILLRE